MHLHITSSCNAAWHNKVGGKLAICHDVTSPAWKHRMYSTVASTNAHICAISAVNTSANCTRYVRHVLLVHPKRCNSLRARFVRLSEAHQLKQAEVACKPGRRCQSRIHFRVQQSTSLAILGCKVSAGSGLGEVEHCRRCNSAVCGIRQDCSGSQQLQ